MSGTGKPPVKEFVDWAELTLTNRCNQRCFFCYEDGREVASEPTLEEVKRILDETRKEVRQAVLCGKEVLLRPDILEVIGYGTAIGLGMSVFTNGQALAKPGLVAELVSAGCEAIQISFHFPDGAGFVRGARTHASGFERQLEGIRRVGEYNRAHPERILYVGTETDMSILNAGRLAEMRQTLIDAFGDHNWHMRLASLVPADVYDVGEPLISEEMAVRRFELADFVRTQPPTLPLCFVKTPLCLLPRESQHLSVELEYVRRGTLLTFNHLSADQISVDRWSISKTRGVQDLLRESPYRWVCRTCKLAAVCRFERTSWHFEFFRPVRGQKPEPVLETDVSDLLTRLGASPAEATSMDSVAQTIACSPFPEEEILKSLRHAPADSPTLLEAWAHHDPILNLLLDCDGVPVELHLGAPSAAWAPQGLAGVVGYLMVSAVGTDIPPVSALAAFRTLASISLPDLEVWKGTTRFHVGAGRLLLAAWSRLGEALWPRLGGIGSWGTKHLALPGNGSIDIILENDKGATVALCWRAVVGGTDEEPAERVTVSPVTSASVVTDDDWRDLLSHISRLFGDGAVLDQIIDSRGLGQNTYAFDGRTWSVHPNPGCEERGSVAGHPSGPRLCFQVQEATGGGSYVLNVAPFQEGSAFYHREGGLVLWYQGELSAKLGVLFARILIAVMRHVGREPLTEPSVPYWTRTVSHLLERNGLAAQYGWTAKWLT